MAFYDGRVHDFPQADATSSAVFEYNMPNDTTSGGYNYCTQGQQPPSDNTTSAVASPDAAYPVHHQDSQSDESTRLIVHDPTHLAPSCNAPTRLIVDTMGFFFSGEEFYIKELAFYNPATHTSWHGLFKPPFQKGWWKKKGIDFLKHGTDFHGLNWESGEYPYSALYSIFAFFSQNAVFYAKGDFKCRWIQQFASTTVVNLGRIGCPSLKELPHECTCIHHNTYRKECALNNAVKLGKEFAKMYDMNAVPPPQPPTED